MNEEKNIMPLAIAILYCEPSSHREDCYFCLIKIEGLYKTRKYKVEPASVPSAMKPVPHADHLAVFNTLNAELNPIRHFLALLGAHHILRGPR